MNKFLLTILSFCSLSLVAADGSAEQFRRETESKLARAAERERQEVQAIADEINAQEDEEEVRDAADYSDDELESNKQVDLKDQVAQQQDQAQHDLKAAEDILYNLKPTGSQGFKGPGLPKNLQQLVANYVGSDGQAGWRLFKTIEGLKGPVVAKVVGKLIRKKTDPFYKNYFNDKNGLISCFYEGSLSTKSDCNVFGKFMVTGESDGNLKLWNINPYKCIFNLNLRTPIRSITANRTGELLAISFTDISSTAVIKIVQNTDQSKSLKVLQVFSGSREGDFKLSFYTGESLKKELISPKSMTCSQDECPQVHVPFNPEDEEEFLCRRYAGNKMRIIWNVKTWLPRGLADYNSSPNTHECAVTRMCYDTAVRYKKRNPSLNDTILKKAITCLHTHPKNNAAIKFDCHAQALSDGSIRIISNRGRHEHEQEFASGQNGINGLQAFYSPTQNIAYILSSADDGTIKIWENILQEPFKTCAHCHKDKHADKATQLMDCACKQIKYCSPECQKADWKNHKATCSAKPKKEIRTIDSLD